MPTSHCFPAYSFTLLSPRPTLPLSSIAILPLHEQVSWVTCDYKTGPGVVQAQSTPGSTSLHYWRAEWECERPSYYPAYADAETKETEDDAVKASEGSVDAEVAFRRKHQQSRNYDKPSESHYKQGNDNYYQHKESHKHDEPSYSHYKQGGDNYGQHKQPHNYDEPSESHYKQGGDNYGQAGNTDRCGKPMKATGVTTSYFYDYSGIDPTNNYASGIIHHVLIKGEVDWGGLQESFYAS